MIKVRLPDDTIEEIEQSKYKEFAAWSRENLGGSPRLVSAEERVEAAAPGVQPFSDAPEEQERQERAGAREQIADAYPLSTSIPLNALHGAVGFAVDTPVAIEALATLGLQQGFNQIEGYANDVPVAGENWREAGQLAKALGHGVVESVEDLTRPGALTHRPFESASTVLGLAIPAIKGAQGVAGGARALNALPAAARAGAAAPQLLTGVGEGALSRLASAPLRSPLVARPLNAGLALAEAGASPKGLDAARAVIAAKEGLPPVPIVAPGTPTTLQEMRRVVEALPVMGQTLKRLRTPEIPSVTEALARRVASPPGTPEATRAPLALVDEPFPPEPTPAYVPSTRPLFADARRRVGIERVSAAMPEPFDARLEGMQSVTEAMAEVPPSRVRGTSVEHLPGEWQPPRQLRPLPISPREARSLALKSGTVEKPGKAGSLRERIIEQERIADDLEALGDDESVDLAQTYRDEADYLRRQAEREGIGQRSFDVRVAKPGITSAEVVDPGRFRRGGFGVEEEAAVEEEMAKLGAYPTGRGYWETRPPRAPPGDYTDADLMTIAKEADPRRAALARYALTARGYATTPGDNFLPASPGERVHLDIRDEQGALRMLDTTHPGSPRMQDPVRMGGAAALRRLGARAREYEPPTMPSDAPLPEVLEGAAEAESLGPASARAAALEQAEAARAVVEAGPTQPQSVSTLVGAREVPLSSGDPARVRSVLGGLVGRAPVRPLAPVVRLPVGQPQGTRVAPRVRRPPSPPLPPETPKGGGGRGGLPGAWGYTTDALRGPRNSPRFAPADMDDPDFPWSRQALREPGEEGPDPLEGDYGPAGIEEADIRAAALADMYNLPLPVPDVKRIPGAPPVRVVGWPSKPMRRPGVDVDRLREQLAPYGDVDAMIAGIAQRREQTPAVRLVDIPDALPSKARARLDTRDVRASELPPEQRAQAQALLDQGLAGGAPPAVVADGLEMLAAQARAQGNGPFAAWLEQQAALLRFGR